MNEYATTDPNRAAFLLCRGCRLVRTTLIEDGARVEFVFSNPNGRTDEAVNGLVNNDPVGIRDFVAAMSSVRSAMYATKTKGGA